MKSEMKKYFAWMVCIFAVYLCIRYWDGFVDLLLIALSAATPLLVGAIIAYAVNILMSCYERKLFVKTKNKYLMKGKRPICMVLAFLSLIAIIAMIFILVVPELVNCAKYLLVAIPKGAYAFVNALEENELLNQYAVELEAMLNENFAEMRTEMASGLKSIMSGVGGVMTSVISAVGSVFSGIVTALVSLIFSIYILLGKEKLAWQCERLLHTYVPKHQPRISYIVRTFDECFHNFIVGQCTEAVILGSLCAVGMCILQLPYALMIGVLIGFTALIPIAGAYIGAGVGAFMILTISPVKALIFLIFIVVLQQMEGNLIYPKVVGNSIGLPGMWVLAAITIGGGLLGVLGMLFAVPIAAALYHLLQTDIRKRNHEL